MATPPLVFEFIGIVFTAILYGLYCLIFGLYWRIQLKRADRCQWKGAVFFYALNVIFILCTAYFIIAIILVQSAITRVSSAVLTRNGDSLPVESAVNGMNIANNTLYISIDFISQLILLYRCWIMWRKPLVMVIPCILSLAFLVDNLRLPDWWSSAVTAFFFISLGVHTLVTAMIAYKIITVYHDIRRLRFDTSYVQARAHGDSDASGHRDLYPLISILIESGLITFVGQLVQSIMYKFANNAFPLVSGCVVMLYGISMTAVLVRVQTGDSLHIKDSGLNEFGAPVLTPFALKTVGRSDSSE